MVIPHLVTDAISTLGRVAGNHVHFLCTTEAELPAIGVIDGDEAYCQDTGNPFTRIGGAWVLNASPPVVAKYVQETSGPTSLLVGSILDGQHIVRTGTALVGANEATLISKTANETISSTTVLHNDNTLFVPMLANQTYRFRLTAYFDTVAAADFKFRHAGPAAPVSVRIFRFTILPAAIAFSNIAIDTAYSDADVVCLSASGNGGYVVLDADIVNGPNAGNFNFQWAQNTSNAGNTTVLKGSNVDWRKV